MIHLRAAAAHLPGRIATSDGQGIKSDRPTARTSSESQACHRIDRRVDAESQRIRLAHRPRSERIDSERLVPQREVVTDRVQLQGVVFQ